jgi:hypothetical protein
MKSYAAILIFLFIQTETVLAHSKHPLGKQQLEWQTDVNISRTLTMNIDFHGGDWFVTWRRPGHVEERDGHQCLVGPYFFFDVDDRFAFDIDETVTLELLFDRSETDGFNLSYDHAINPKAKQVRLNPNYKERWERVTVQLERARLANRKYEKTDFAIGALGAKHPQPKGVNAELVLCGLKITREQQQQSEDPQYGILELAIRNEEKSSDSVRVGLYDAQGRSPLPSDEAVTLEPFSEPFKQWPLLNRIKNWPSDGRYVFYVDGSYRAHVPAGSYDLVIYKGPEYRLIHRKLKIEAGKSKHIEVELKRWINMPAKGWYSGDAHIHIARPDSSKNKSTLAYTQAEDIHVANLLQVSNVASGDNYPQYAFGRAGHFIGSNHALVSGQESPRSSHRGHSIGLNASKYIWTKEDYFLYNDIAARIHQDGGLWGYAHVAIDVFNVHYGLALDVPLGAVDFLEILQMSTLNTSYLYDFLNLGYKLLPAAGSDYPFIHMAGSERTYVNVGEQFSPRAWFDAWSNKRSFVSNGPVVEFKVNGDSDKFEFDLAQGDTVSISAKASVNPDIDHLSRLELVIHGKVVKTVTSDLGSESLELSYDFQAHESLWLAIRAYGKGNATAHTAPVYLYVDGNQHFWNPALVKDIATKYIGVLASFKASTPNLDEDWERFDTENALLPQWEADKQALDSRINKAISIYERLIREATELEQRVRK